MGAQSRARPTAGAAPGSAARLVELDLKARRSLRRPAQPDVCAGLKPYHIGGRLP